MAALGSVSITSSVTGLPTGSKSFNFALSSANASGEVIDVLLAAGDNLIDVPPNASMVFIDPPSTNTTILTLKGAAADVGFAIHPSQVTFLPLPSGTAQLRINAAAALTQAVEFSFV